MKAGVVKAFTWDGNKIQRKNKKDMKKFLYSIVALAGVLFSACEPTEIEGGAPDRTVTGETFEYTVTPIWKVVKRLIVFYWKHKVLLLAHGTTK